MSNYGIHLRTVIPYTLALAAASLSSLYVASACRRFPQSDRTPLLVYGLLMMAVLLSTYPYMVSHAWHTLHELSGVLLVTFELLTVCWWGLRCHFRWRGVWVIGQSLGSVLALLTFANEVHLLFLSQVVTSIRWGAMMIGRFLTYPSGIS